MRTAATLRLVADSSSADSGAGLVHAMFVAAGPYMLDCEKGVMGPTWKSGENATQKEYSAVAAKLLDFGLPDDAKRGVCERLGWDANYKRGRENVAFSRFR